MNTDIPADILNDAYMGDINAQEILAIQFGVDIRPKFEEKEDLKNMDKCEVCGESSASSRGDFIRL